MKAAAFGLGAWVLVLAGLRIALLRGSHNRCARCRQRIDDPATGEPVRGCTPAAGPESDRALCPDCSTSGRTNVVPMAGHR